jgi:hypothetical protein
MAENKNVPGSLKNQSNDGQTDQLLPSATWDLGGFNKFIVSAWAWHGLTIWI